MNDNNNKWPELISGRGSHLAEVKAYFGDYNRKKKQEKFANALQLVEEKIKALRNKTPNLPYSKTKLAEVEINKFFYEGETVDRVMIVLRSNGCQHYKKNGGCSMCAHLNGSPLMDKITHQNYVEQWNSVLDGSFIEKEGSFNLNDYPVVCVYNLGSLLNEEEISKETIKYIFSTLNEYKGVKKVIIESRAEYVKEDMLKVIRDVYDGVVEVGILRRGVALGGELDVGVFGGHVDPGLLAVGDDDFWVGEYLCILQAFERADCEPEVVHGKRAREGAVRRVRAVGIPGVPPGTGHFPRQRHVRAGRGVGSVDSGAAGVVK